MQVKQSLGQPEVLQTGSQLSAIKLIRKQILHRREPCARRFAEAIQKRVFSKEHAEVDRVAESHSRAGFELLLGNLLIRLDEDFLEHMTSHLYGLIDAVDMQDGGRNVVHRSH